MTQEERDFLKVQFDALKEKIDDVVDPVKSDLGEVKRTVANHQAQLHQFEAFKEGHQKAHAEAEKRAEQAVEKKRYGWELFASTGIIGIIFGALIGFFMKG